MGETTGGHGIDRGVLLAQLAVQKGWITSAQLRTALADVKEGRGSNLPEALLHHGFLHKAQIEQLLAVLGRSAVPSFPPFGKFLLHRELGRGAMGVVYEAEDSSSGDRVALKLLIEPGGRSAEEAQPELDRFLRESELLRKIPPHPGLVGIREAGVVDGRRFLAMDLVDGVHFGAWRKRGSLNIRQQIGALRDVALAVDHAHRHGIVHRDLKPENVLVDRDHRARVTDFGLAKAMGSVGLPTLTAAGTALGTPAYMSPEQVQGLKTVDGRTDVYSLGVMLYEILTGRTPFEGGSTYEIMMKTVHEPVTPPSKITNLKLNPVMYRNLENICMLALAKDPGHRYPDAASFGQDLTRWLHGEEVKVVLPPAWRLWRARKLFPKFALAASAVLVAVAVWVWRDARRAPEAPPGPASQPAFAPLDRTFPVGTIAEYAAGLNHNALGLRTIDLRPRFDDPKRPLWDGYHGYWTSRRWTGLLKVPATATYVFELRALESARAFLDGQELVAAAGLPAARTLAAGWHRLQIEHSHKEAEDTVRLLWGRQGDTTLVDLGPASLSHDAAAYTPVQPTPGRFWKRPHVPGAEEGETLKVLEDSGRKPNRNPYDKDGPFWRGTWSGDAHLWWGPGVGRGDRLKLRFSAGEAGRGTLVLGLTRTSDHGIFKVRVNGAVIAEAMDLCSPIEAVTGPTEFKNVEFRQGANELEFEVVGSNPDAREWGPGCGLHKLGLDYVLVK
jgi:hypothetical protein